MESPHELTGLDVLSSRSLSPRPDRLAVSTSPPPSFYRASNANTSSNHTPSPSPSRTKARNTRIQFTAPPPPIATSSLLLSPAQLGGGTAQADLGASQRGANPRLRRGSAGVDPLLGLERRERALQNGLQTLLDAQSEGLVHGFGGDQADGSSDAGSSTPTSRSVVRSGGGGVMPVRQPKRKPLGLRGARRGLLRDMGDLAEIKTEQLGILDAEIESREDALRMVNRWEERMDIARAELSGYSEDGGGGGGEERGGDEGREIAELRAEEKAADSEIREMEDRLAQMKARKTWLGERINEGLNKREARLSSYRGALKEIESEAQQFLKRPPIPVSVVMGDEEGFMSLPAHRRTLGMASEWWKKEVSQLQNRQASVEKERSALDEGAKLWEESMDIVMNFEENLRKQVKSSQPQDVEMLRTQTKNMEEVITRLEANARMAENKHWNLLICAIGAELEAFKEGRRILKGALDMAGGSHGQEMECHDGSNNSDTGELNGSLRKPETAEDSEDDGPNLAELLVDHGSDDTS